jgi:hypothetical protein
MIEFHANSAFSDRFMPAVHKIVGPLLCVRATREQDCREATDLVVPARSIAVRVRRWPILDERWLDEFTIRGSSESGAATEIHKIIRGRGDWLFYGHQAAPDPCDEIGRWMVVDLDALRAVLICARPHLLHQPDNETSGLRENKDGKTSLWFFNVRRLPPSVLVAEGGEATANVVPLPVRAPPVTAAAV